MGWCNNSIRGNSGGSASGKIRIYAGGDVVGYFGGASAGGTGGLLVGGDQETDYKFEVLGSGAVHNLLASGDITVDGSVGIGMFTAGDKLTVDGTLSTKHTGYTTNALRVTHNSNDVYLSLYKRADQSTQAIKLGTAGDSYFNGGDLGIRTTSPDATLHAVAANATDIGIISQGASSQSANLQEWRASDDSILAKVASDGDFSNNGDIEANDRCESFGDGAYVSGVFANAFGNFATAKGSNSPFAVGFGATAEGTAAIAIGYNALRQSGGNYKVAIGASAGYQATSFERSTAVGGLFCAYKSGGSYHSFFGSYAGYQCSGNYNVGIGLSALRESTGSRNIEISNKSSASTSSIGSLSDRLDIGDGAIRGDLVNNRIGVNISDHSPDSMLSVNSSSSSTPVITAKGAVSQTANLTEWRASDDSILAKVASDGDISTSGDVSAFKYRNDGTNNLILDSTANMYVAFGGTINYGFFNTAFQPQIDNGRQLGTSSKRWSQGYIVNLNSVHGDFTGNVDVDGTVTGGLFKLYGLGDSAATDSEFLQVAHVANTYYISTKKTGSATGRDLILQRDSQNALKLASAEITSYKSMIPSTDGTLNLGSSSYKWGTVTASKLDIETTGVDDAIALTSTDAGSSAAPVFTMMRDSASPADGDYLGQIKFKGRSDTGTERIYAKITGKVLDASNASEDGLIEIAVRSDGSNEIVSRIRNDGIRILNDNNLIIEDNGSIGIRTTSPSYGLDVSATGIFRQSVIIPDHVPATTTNALYNDAGTLKL